MKQIFNYLLLLSAATVIACGPSEEQRQQISRAERQRLMREDSLALKIACLPTMDALPLWVAQDCGLFDREQVDVRLKHFNAHMDVDTALAGGSVEGALTDSLRADFLEHDGLQLERFAPTVLSWKLIANRNARLKATRQLGDKMIAMTRHSATEYLSDKVLEGVKTTATVFRVQINDVNLRLDMLFNNAMDAMWLPEPQATQALLAGHNQLADSRQIKDPLGILVFNRNAVGDEHRQSQVAAFTRAYRAACDTIDQAGVTAFSDIIKKYTGIHDTTVVDSLPPLHYHYDK